MTREALLAGIEQGFDGGVEIDIGHLELPEDWPADHDLAVAIGRQIGLRLQQLFAEEDA